MIVLGAAAALIGGSLVIGGATLLGAQLSLRDSYGYYSSSTYDVRTDSYAVVLDGVDLDLGRWAGSPVAPRDLGSIRVTTEPASGKAVFAGVARTADVDRYLAQVAHDRVADVDRRTIDVRAVPGGLTPAPPVEQGFWVASSAGTGAQSLTWPVEDGRWSVVVMNVDGTAPVDVTARAGARVAYLTPVALGLVALGTLCLIGAGAALSGRRSRRHPVPVRPSHDEVAYPITVSASLGAAPGRWLWLVKWILLVPHILVLTLLWAGFVLTSVAAGAAILLTGRYPRPLFDFNVGVLRWTWRVGQYGYLSLSTDRYPPFTLRPAPYPATLDVAYPQHLSRWLVLVKWLLVIPHLLVVGILLGSTFGRSAGSSVPWTTGGLIGLLVLLAALHLALVRRYPNGLFDLLIGLNRWLFRVIGYTALMTDTYPPFRLDLGGADPGAAPVRAVEPGAELVRAAPDQHPRPRPVPVHQPSQEETDVVRTPHSARPQTSRV
jgi:hypothetical protein